jgi:hypothetical protein
MNGHQSNNMQVDVKAHNRRVRDAVLGAFLIAAGLTLALVAMLVIGR